MKLSPIKENGVIAAYMFECPGCGGGHIVHVRPYKNEVGASWDFSHNMEFPTFTPSLLTKLNRSDEPVRICHLFITNGQIRFLADCTHNLAGQTVDMIDH